MSGREALAWVAGATLSFVAVGGVLAGVEGMVFALLMSGILSTAIWSSADPSQ